MGQIKNIKLHIVTDIKSTMNKVVAILLIGIIIQSDATQVTSSCSPSNWNVAWSRISDTWYTIIPSPDTWHNMEKKCRSIEPGRTTMGRITNNHEFQHVYNRLLSNTNHAWLGGVRVAQIWFKWYDSIGKKLQDLTFTNWGTKQPDYNGHCITMDKWNGGHWWDNDCNQKYSGVCELRC